MNDNELLSTRAVSRREFLHTSAVAATALTLIDSGLAASGQAAPNAAVVSWFDGPMRWAQLTLVEDDPGKYDPQFWLDYFKRTHSDAACLSAGGYIAYYPTKVPLHYRSRWMKDTDPFGQLVAGCRRLNMRILARTDSHAVHNDVYEAHPDWIAVDAEGRKRRHWAMPEAWVTCGLGPYNFEFMTDVHREIMTLYKVDGIFTNRWDGSGMCYCEHCQRNFQKAYNMELPRTNDPQNPQRRSYIVWRQARLFELWRLWDAEIRKINQNARYVANAGGGALSELDMKTIGDLSDILFADRQARRGLAAPWSNGKNGKEYRATMGRKPIGGIFSVGLEEPYRWKDSVQSAAEIRMWVLDGIANGLRPWFTKFSGKIYDKRWLKVVEDVYIWHYQSEKYLRNEAPLARVGVVYSQQTATFYGGEKARERTEDYTLGMYQALIEARIPFEMVHDKLLDGEHTDKFKLLILPNIAALSDEGCNQVRQFVNRGGSLLATYETSLYDEWGIERKDFGLSDLFGVSFKNRPEKIMQNSYLRLEKNSNGKYHPLLAGLENTERIINGVRRLEVTAQEKFPVAPLTLIPSYPDLPMEEVYPRTPKTNIPEVYLRELGKHRVVYFPWDIDRTFWEVMSTDHGRLLRNAVEWAMNEDQPITVTGPGMLDVTVWRQKESMTVHLVNLTNPMMMKGPLREFIPTPAQQVRVRLPKGRQAKKVQLLVSGQPVRVEESGDYLNFTVASILDHEVVAIDL
ncbi:MAG: beta-galactosidase trimerization domain-containing protein [Acidobacteriota bacterium]|nr:beta-galactosidase trimerization domain-containing protein [Acidobacteriota bacterium]